jgi:hypothetical protein
MPAFQMLCYQKKEAAGTEHHQPAARITISFSK